MSEEWSNKTSKKGRRKKGFSHQQKAAQKKAAQKRKEEAKLRAKTGGYHKENGNRSPPREPQRPRLDDRQWRVLQQMQRGSDFYDCDEALLSKIILDLDLKRPQQLEDKRIKVQILDLVVSEWQNKAGGKAAKNKKKKDQNTSINGMLTPSTQGTLSPMNAMNVNGLNGVHGRNGMNKKGRDGVNGKSKPLKSGKFKKFMNSVGTTFLDFVDVNTLCSMIRIGAFTFIPLDRRIMNERQRLKAYTSSKDIEYRLKAFNTTLNVTSTLKLYELKRAQNVEVKQCLEVIMANGLCLDHRFRGKNDSEYLVFMDLAKSGMMEAAAKEVKGKCKQLNVWRSNTVLDDLNAAYLVEFAEFQATQRQLKGLQGMKPPVSATRRDDEGRRYLRMLDDLVMDRKVIGKENVQSVHCCYLKVHRPQQYEMHSYLWLFIELKTLKTEQINNKRPKRGRGPRTREERRPFMVWKGQCGITKL